MLLANQIKLNNDTTSQKLHDYLLIVDKIHKIYNTINDDDDDDNNAHIILMCVFYKIFNVFFFILGKIYYQCVKYRINTIGYETLNRHRESLLHLQYTQTYTLIDPIILISNHLFQISYFCLEFMCLLILLLENILIL